MAADWLGNVGVSGRVKRLKASITHYRNGAIREAGMAANKAASLAADAKVFGTGQDIATALDVDAALASALPHIFAAYTDERRGTLFDPSDLKEEVREGIKGMFEDAEQLLKPSPAFGETRKTYRSELGMAKSRALEQAEEHFRRPGLPPWHQRFILPFGALAFIVGAIFQELCAWIFGRIDLP